MGEDVKLSGVPAEQSAFGVDEAWHELVEKDDRTSPEPEGDEPEMALITFDELKDFMVRARSTQEIATDVAAGTTPAAKWRAEGKSDPHGVRYDCERAGLAGGHMTDDEVANAVYLDPSIENLTIAKDRIRWLSRQMVASRSRPETLKQDEDWREDPSADERWQAGCDFALVHLCMALGVDSKSVNFDAATESLDGDVIAVIWNILRAKMGDDWDPDAPAGDARKAAIEESAKVCDRWIRSKNLHERLAATDIARDIRKLAERDR